MRMNDG
jgi:hypothetical protein